MREAFQIADRYVDELCALHPTLATSLGVPGHDHEWGDTFGLDGVESSTDLARRYRTELAPHLNDPDPAQRRAAIVTVALIDENLAAYEAGDHFRDLRHLGSLLHRIRSVFDLMPTATSEAWENITRRLDSIERPLADYRRRLEAGVGRGITVARRQVESILDQINALSGPESAFDLLVEKAVRIAQPTDRLEAAVDHAKAKAAEFGQWLESDYLPHAREEDAAGADLYRRFADRLVGMAVDPREAYEWGWEEFHRLQIEMRRTGEHILPGADVLEVKDFLDNDEEGAAASPKRLLEYVDGVLRRAVEELAGRHFEVPEPIRPLTVQLAPPGGPLSVYYMRPSEDFSRPGGVWYAIGDQTVFPLYQHVSTAYHEGFPGHHLQIGTAMLHKNDLSRVQRVLTWYPGYSEGWAMYAEVLMGELGYLADPRHYFGMLAKQMYRAARIVVDVGLHLSLPIPESSPMAPGGRWTFATAVEFMRVYGFRTPAQAEAEVLRYLGWPGQAIAYKLGEREILSIRAEVSRRLGGAFDIKRFHATVLGSGPMRLDLLREVVREQLR